LKNKEITFHSLHTSISLSSLPEDAFSCVVPYCFKCWMIYCRPHRQISLYFNGITRVVSYCNSNINETYLWKLLTALWIGTNIWFYVWMNPLMLNERWFMSKWSWANWAEVKDAYQLCWRGFECTISWLWRFLNDFIRLWQA